MKCGHNDCFTCPFEDCIVDGSNILKSGKRSISRMHYERDYYEKHKEYIRQKQHEYYLRRKNEQLRMAKKSES